MNGELIKRLQQGIEYPSPSSADPDAHEVVFVTVEDAKDIVAALTAQEAK